jgi:hypothetical protein
MNGIIKVFYGFMEPQTESYLTSKQNDSWKPYPTVQSIQVWSWRILEVMRIKCCYKTNDNKYEGNNM